MIRPDDPFNAFLDYPQLPVSNANSGPLAGLTLAVKDIFDVAGYKTGWGNPERLGEARVATTTNSAIQHLLDSGARFIGKTQTEELAFSMIGQNVHFPHPVNPAAPDRVTGGSSSGSAAAVAGGLVDIATGSDTGGSIRCPASFCGLIGLRTTHGAISLDHTMALAPSFDTFGWFARDMETYLKVAEVLLPKAFDALTRPLYATSLDALVVPECLPEYRRLSKLVATVAGAPSAAPVSPYSLDELYWTTRKLQAREAWTAHGAWISSGDRKLGKATYDRFAFGQAISDADVFEETAKRDAFRIWLGDLLGDDGFLILPTVTDIAPLSKSTLEQFSAFREASIRLLCWSGLSGFPQLTLPVGAVDGAPFGISLLGPAGSDLALLDLGKRILQSAQKA